MKYYSKYQLKLKRGIIYFFEIENIVQKKVQNIFFQVYIRNIISKNN